MIISLFQSSKESPDLTRGDAPSSLCPWLSYGAPLALRNIAAPLALRNIAAPLALPNVPAALALPEYCRAVGASGRTIEAKLRGAEQMARQVPSLRVQRESAVSHR